jgi:hypothetical protein
MGHSSYPGGLGLQACSPATHSSDAAGLGRNEAGRAGRATGSMRRNCSGLPTGLGFERGKKLACDKKLVTVATSLCGIVVPLLHPYPQFRFSNA